MKQLMRYQDVIAGLAWFAALIAINIGTREPTQFILAYAVPVVITTWKRNLQWGFLFAALGAFSAVASGAITGNVDAGVGLAEEGLFSFAQLSAIAVGVVLGKRTHRKRVKLIDENQHHE